MKKIELDFTEQIKAQKEDHEVSMAKTQLMKISQQAGELAAMMGSASDQENIMAWAQDKISKAEHFIEAVYDYMKYK